MSENACCTHTHTHTLLAWDDHVELIFAWWVKTKCFREGMINLELPRDLFWATEWHYVFVCVTMPCVMCLLAFPLLLPQSVFVSLSLASCFSTLADLIQSFVTAVHLAGFYPHKWGQEFQDFLIIPKAFEVWCECPGSRAGRIYPRSFLINKNSTWQCMCV